MIAGTPPERTTSAAPVAAASASVWPLTSPSMIWVSARLAISPASRKTSSSRALLTCCTDLDEVVLRAPVDARAPFAQPVHVFAGEEVGADDGDRAGDPVGVEGIGRTLDRVLVPVPVVGREPVCGIQELVVVQLGLPACAHDDGVVAASLPQIVVGRLAGVPRIVVDQPEQVGTAVVGARAPRPDDGRLVAPARHLAVDLGPARLVFLPGKDLARHGRAPDPAIPTWPVAIAG